MGRRDVFVVGGAGYVGSHAAKALAEAGYRPIVFDNLSTGHADSVRWGPLVEADLADRKEIGRALDRFQPAAVMHFAAHAYVGESVTDPAKYYRNNVANTLNLLDEMRARNVRRLVFSSTCATYGMPSTLPIDERHPQQPINPYGHTKLVVERILWSYRHAYGLSAVALRYFNAAGADVDGTLGEKHDPETHLIPLAILSALGARGELQIFGSDYPTEDGTAVRDFIHVTDLASAHVLALQYLIRGGSSTALNLGVGRGFSVREVIASVERATGARVPVVEAARRQGDPAELVADASLAREILGWKPMFRDLDPVVASAVDWHRRDLESTDPADSIRAPETERPESVHLPA